MKRTLLNNVISYTPAPIPATVGAAAGAIDTGIIIDRQGCLSAVLGIAIGEIAGAPTKAAITLGLLTGDAADGSDMAALDDKRAVLPKATIEVEADKTYSMSIDLIGCKRYIKLAPTVAYTGGTTPTMDITATALTLGDADNMPIPAETLLPAT